MRAIQQGDVFFLEVESVPKGASAVKAGDRGYILAEGETTGHAHVMEPLPGLDVTEKDGMFFIRVPASATVTHEEHKPVTVPAGIWKVSKVREYDHFVEEARSVQD